MKLGQVIRRWRLVSEIDLRTAGKEIGISAATLMRLEHETNIPSGKVLAKILVWLLK